VSVSTCRIVHALSCIDSFRASIASLLTASAKGSSLPDFVSGKLVLVNGATGRLGCEVCKKLLCRGANVIVSEETEAEREEGRKDGRKGGKRGGRGSDRCGWDIF